MYGKSFESKFTGSLYGKPALVFAVWDYATTHMRRAKDGQCYVEINPTMLAPMFATDVKSVNDALDTLEAPDPNSRTPEEEGRRLVLRSARHDGPRQYWVVNGTHYRELQKDEERREYNRLAQRKHRKKGQVPSKPVKNVNDTRATSADPSASASASGSDSEREGEREGERSPPPDNEHETMCPTDLVERAESVGVFERMADALREPKPSLVECAREFVGYWTIGAGAGKRRRQWMRKLREHLRRASLEHRLKPLGALEHEERTSSGDATHDKTKHLRDMARRMEGK